MITYCTCSGATPARSNAALIAAPPRVVAGRSLRLPSNLPIGVRAPPTITEVMACLSALTLVRSDYPHDRRTIPVTLVTPGHRPATDRSCRDRGARPGRGRRLLCPGVRDALRARGDERG